MKTINSLKIIRAISGLNQSQIATYLGCSQSKVSLVENGLAGLTESELDRLSKILNLPTDSKLQKTIIGDQQ